MNKRTRATAISKRTKEAVFKRDGGKCVLCGRWADPSWACAHYIRRSHGGLGVEKNILTLCPSCHRAFDEGIDKTKLRAILSEYLADKYDDWCESELVYRKGET